MSTEKIIIVVISVLIVLGIWANIVERREWEAFKAEHNCKIVGKTKATSSVGITTAGDGGLVVLTKPSRTGWKCDDGITYWR